MRSLLISIVALGLHMSAYGWAFTIADHTIREINEAIYEEMIPAVSREDWQRSKEELVRINALWQKDRTLFSVLFDAVSIGEIEGTLAKLDAYLREEETANAGGELSSLSQQLSFLLENEKLSLENAF